MAEIVEQKENWTQTVECRFCTHTFTVTANDVKYGDLRQPFLFVPDWQYYVVCTECGKNIIVHVPSRIAVWIQDNNLDSE